MDYILKYAVHFFQMHFHKDKLHLLCCVDLKVSTVLLVCMTAVQSCCWNSDDFTPLPFTHQTQRW